MNKANDDRTGTRGIVRIPANGIQLEGAWAIPDRASGIVLFAHGSGSSRHSPRNNFVAEVVQQAGFGTLLMDLLTLEEDRDYQNRFDIDLLTSRLERATEWIMEQPQSKSLDIGYFGASTGAAAALYAAAGFGPAIGAVVSRGGRPDLAKTILYRVQAPTLLIVGGSDDVVIELNREAYRELHAQKELRIIPALLIYSRSPAPFRRLRVWPRTGSRNTSAKKPRKTRPDSPLVLPGR
jgi:dienelactone hydrolase